MSYVKCECKYERLAGGIVSFRSHRQECYLPSDEYSKVASKLLPSECPRKYMSYVIDGK